MNRLILAAASSAVLLVVAGCVSSSSRPAKTESPTDAAQYNLQLGVSYLRQNNIDAAKEKLEKAIEQDPDLATAHAALGLVFERLEDLPGAERHYRRAVAIDDGDPDTLNSLAVFLCAKRGNPEDGLRFFDRALAIPLSRKNANRAMLNANAGTCAKSVDLPRAESYLRTALEQDPKFADALLQLAEVSLARGNALQARGFVERYLAGGSSSAAILWIGVQVERALKDETAARRYSERLQSDFPGAPETRLMLQQQGSRG